jgi:hypothetical protein
MRSREEAWDGFQKIALERKKRRKKIASERKKTRSPLFPCVSMESTCMEKRVTWLLDGG